MIRFHQTFGAHAGRVVTFEKDVITFGRLPTCDVAFDARADIDASAQHAEVRREQGAWYVLDANSRNGTWLNGQRVSRAALASGDELELGRGGPRLRVEIAQPVTGPMEAPPRAALGLLPTAQWTPEEFAPVAAQAAQAGGGAASVRPPPGGGSGSMRPPPGGGAASVRPPPGGGSGSIRPPSNAAANAPPPAHYAPPPAPLAPKTPLRPPPSGGLGLGVAVLVGAVALLFAALAAGVLVWRLSTTSASHAPPRPRLPPGSAVDLVAATVGPATYLVAAHSPDGSLRPLCTAFAVRSDLVATTGHCVKRIEQARAAGTAVDLLRPGLPGPVGIAAMYLHPAFDPAVAGVSHDIGVLRTAGPLAALVTLPTLDDLRALTPGSAAYVVTYLGAPTQGPAAPRPVVVAGALGTPEHFDGTPSAFDDAQLVPHSAPVEEGGMGAPVLDDTGLVIAVHASEQRTTPSLSVRADVLLALIAGLGA